MGSKQGKVLLGDAADVLTGFPFKGDKYGEEGIRVLRGENVTIGDIRWDTIKCWNLPFKELDKYSLAVGDIVIGMDGSRVGRNRAQIRKYHLPLLLAQRVARLRAKAGYSQDFLAYVVKSDSFEKYIDAVKTGTSIPHISPQQIKEFGFTAPDLPSQKKIASILSSLDDKIELNRQTNATLEAIAQALFKEWFVDFNYPGATGEMVESELGMIPKGWKAGRLGDVCELAYGKALKADVRVTGQFPVVGSSGIVDYHKEFLVEAPGIVIGRKGTIGEVTWLHSNFFPIDTTFYIVDRLGTDKLYYHYFLLKEQDFKKIGSDSAVPGLNRNEAYGNEIVVPSSEVITSFNELVKPLFDIIHNNEQQNHTLTQLRDSLLPRLMKGELHCLIN